MIVIVERKTGAIERVPRASRQPGAFYRRGSVVPKSREAGRQEASISLNAPVTDLTRALAYFTDEALVQRVEKVVEERRGDTPAWPTRRCAHGVHGMRHALGRPDRHASHGDASRSRCASRARCGSASSWSSRRIARPSTAGGAFLGVPPLCPVGPRRQPLPEIFTGGLEAAGGLRGPVGDGDRYRPSGIQRPNSIRGGPDANGPVSPDQMRDGEQCASRVFDRKRPHLPR